MRESRIPVAFLGLLLTASFASAASAQTPKCTSTGNLEIVPFVSKGFAAPLSLRILLPAGCRAGLGDDRLCVVVQEGAGHTEKWWAGRLAKALQFLFSPLP